MKTIVKLAGGIVKFALVLFGVVVIPALIIAEIISEIYGYRISITHYATGILIIVAGVLDEVPWPVWVFLAAGIVWAYSHRKDRQRQEMIIELLHDVLERLT